MGIFLLTTNGKVLIEAICVLIYDNTVYPKEYSKDENKERQKIAELVRPELIKRKDIIVEADNSIMKYIQNVVYPQIGIEIKKHSHRS